MFQRIILDPNSHLKRDLHHSLSDESCTSRRTKLTIFSQQRELLTISEDTGAILLPVTKHWQSNTPFLFRNLKTL